MLLGKMPTTALPRRTPANDEECSDMDTAKTTPNSGSNQPGSQSPAATNVYKRRKGNRTNRLFKVKRGVEAYMKEELAGEPELLKTATDFRNKIWQAIRDIEERSPMLDMD